MRLTGKSFGEEILADRSYTLSGGETLRLVLYDPVEREGRWVCRLNIDWPDNRMTDIPGTGADRLQSIFAAVALARISIETTAYYLDGEISWILGQGLYLDVPMPESHVEWVEEQLASRRS